MNTQFVKILYSFTCPYEDDEEPLSRITNKPARYALMSMFLLAVTAGFGALEAVMDAVLDNYLFGPYDQLMAIFSGKNLLSLLAAILAIVLIYILRNHKTAELVLCSCCTANSLIFFSADSGAPIPIAVLFTALIAVCLAAAFFRKKAVYCILAAVLTGASYFVTEALSRPNTFFEPGCLLLALYVLITGMMLRANLEDDPEDDFDDDSEIDPETTPEKAVPIIGE